jgi:hypothetical protein
MLFILEINESEADKLECDFIIKPLPTATGRKLKRLRGRGSLGLIHKK